MIRIFLGPDTYRLQQHIAELETSFRTQYPNGFVAHIDGADADASAQLHQALHTASLFSPVRFVVVKNFFDHAAQLIADTTKNSDTHRDQTTTLIVTDASGEKDLNRGQRQIIAPLADNTPIQSFEPLKGGALVRWIQEECTRQGATIDTEAIAMLTDRAGSDSWTLTQEIAKLTNFSSKISIGDVKQLVSERLDLKIFDMIDAIANRQRPVALDLLYRHIANGQDPYYLLTMIVYQFRNLLTVSDLLARGMTATDIAKKAALHPFVVQKTIRQCQKFSLEELRDAYQHLLALDTESKMGICNLNDELYRFVLQ